MQRLLDDPQRVVDDRLEAQHAPHQLVAEVRGQLAHHLGGAGRLHLGQDQRRGLGMLLEQVARERALDTDDRRSQTERLELPSRSDMIVGDLVGGKHAAEHFQPPWVPHSAPSENCWANSSTIASSSCAVIGRSSAAAFVISADLLRLEMPAARGRRPPMASRSAATFWCRPGGNASCLMGASDLCRHGQLSPCRQRRRQSR